MTAAPDPMLRALTVLGEEAGGFLHVDIVGPAELLPLLLAGASGDEESTKLLRRVHKALDQIDDRQDAGDPVRCCACDRRFARTPPERVAVLRAVRPDGRAYAVLGMCKGCARDPLGAVRKGAEAMGLRGVRICPPMQAGHA